MLVVGHVRNLAARCHLAAKPFHATDVSVINVFSVCWKGRFVQPFSERSWKASLVF